MWVLCFSQTSALQPTSSRRRCTAGGHVQPCRDQGAAQNGTPDVTGPSAQYLATRPARLTLADKCICCIDAIHHTLATCTGLNATTPCSASTASVRSPVVVHDQHISSPQHEGPRGRQARSTDGLNSVCTAPGQATKQLANSSLLCESITVLAAPGPALQNRLQAYA